jgi:hypothetical protein
MRKLLPFFILITFVTLSVNSFAIAPVSSIGTPNKTESVTDARLSKEPLIRILQMKQFARMTLKDYEIAKGRKLNFIERFDFHASQHRVNHLLKKHNYGDDFTFLQKFAWFGKGLVLGPIALLIGYIFLKDEERELIKWIWLGFATLIVVVLIITLVTIL